MTDANVAMGIVHLVRLDGGWRLVVERCSERQWAWRVLDRDDRWVASGCSYLSAERALASAKKAARRAFKGRRNRPRQARPMGGFMATKKRVRVTGTQLRGWDEVDDAIRRYGLLRVQRDEFEAELHRRVTAIKDDMAKEIAPLDSEMESLERAVKEYTEANKEGFKASRSRALTFGTVGFRLSTSLRIKSVAFTVEKLKELRLVGCIRMREEPDKEALRDHSDETLEAVGVKRVQTDAVFFEPDMEKIRSTR
jgi:phage host-nuclease inhibitor protein Gam